MIRLKERVRKRERERRISCRSMHTHTHTNTKGSTSSYVRCKPVSKLYTITLPATTAALTDPAATNLMTRQQINRSTERITAALSGDEKLRRWSYWLLRLGASPSILSRCLTLVRRNEVALYGSVFGDTKQNVRVTSHSASCCIGIDAGCSQCGIPQVQKQSRLMGTSKLHPGNVIVRGVHVA